MITSSTILAKLLLAHFLADFLFQSTKMAEGKRKGLRSSHYYLHIGVVAICNFVFLMDVSFWIAPLVVTGSHALIDLAKAVIETRDNLRDDRKLMYLVIDQALHLGVIVIAWIGLTGTISQLPEIVQVWWGDPRFLYGVLGYLFVTIPAGVLIGCLTSRWRNSMQTVDPQEDDVLVDAGKWIGYCERILVFTFVLIHQFGAIGFLMATKSVFRFGDLRDNRDHKRTEYIVLGSLLSFTFAILTGLLIGQVIDFQKS